MQTISFPQSAAIDSAARRQLIGPIVVATDGRAQSVGAFAAAISIADRYTRDAGLVAKLPVHVITVSASMPVLSPEMTTMVPTEFRDLHRRDMLATAIEQVRYNVADSTSWEVKATYGPPAATIAGAAAEENASLIVMGLGKHDLVDRVFGSETALGVMQRSWIPVLAVPQNWIGVPRRVLIAVDFGRAELRAARTAMSIVAPGGSVCFAHVAARPGQPDDEIRNGDELDRFVEAVGVPADITVNRTQIHGDPARALLDHARSDGIDMIVAGTHGRNALARLFVGSVARTLVRGARCAILVASEPKDSKDGFTGTAVRVSPTLPS